MITGSTLYAIVLPFNYISTGLYTSTFFKDMDKKNAKMLAGIYIYMSLPYLLSVILLPILGTYNCS